MKFESDIIRFLQTNATAGWINFFQAITLLGSFLGLIITLIILLKQNRHLCIPLLITFAVASVINHVLKAIIARSRPFDVYGDIINYAGEDGYSMPSGHSLCAGIFGTYLVYSLFKINKDKLTRILGTIFYSLMTVLIMFSRMVLGVHYISDVIAGAILGIMFAFISIIVYNVVIKKWLDKYKSSAGE